MKPSFGPLVGLGLSLALLTSCGGGAGGDAAAQPVEMADATPPPMPPLPKDVQAGLDAVANTGKNESASVLVETGELVSPVRSELSAKFPGRVGKVFVDDGARVRKGQPLLEIESDYLRLESQRAEAAVTRNQAAVDDAQRDFDRKQGLLEKGSVAQALYDKTKGALDQARAALAEAEATRALAQQRLEDVVLVSPIDGIVAERHADVGERLGEATVAFVIVQVSPVRVRFRLPERHLASVRRGQVVRARVDPFPDEVFEGTVTNVVYAVDAATRTFVVEAEIPNRDERLKPGLFARVELDLEEQAS